MSRVASFPARRAAGVRRGLGLAVLALCLFGFVGPALAKRAEPRPLDPRGVALAQVWRDAADADVDRAVVESLAGLGDRSLGSPGCRTAAAAVEAYFQDLGVGTVGRLIYRTPVMRHGPAFLTMAGREGRLPLAPLALNALTPGAIPPKGLSGPLVDGGQGRYRDFDGKATRGAVALMDLDSGRNWQAAAQLGTAALVYVDHASPGRPMDRGLFADKFELTPVRFPRFLVSAKALADFLGPDAVLDGSTKAPRVTVFASARWEPALAEDVYCFIPGTDPKRAGELLLVDAAYDAGAFVPGHAPGADEAASLAALLRLARTFAAKPPARPVLLVAVSGQARAQAGVRAFFAALRGKGKELRVRSRQLRAEARKIDATLAALAALPPAEADPAASSPDRKPVTLDTPLVRAALFESLKDAVDTVTTTLMRLRLSGGADAATVARLTRRRAVLRRILWRESLQMLSPDEAAALRELVPAAKARLSAARASGRREAACLASARKLRRLVADRDILAQFSLFLSSHGDGVGDFCQGFTYDLKPEISLSQIYGRLNRGLARAGAAQATAQGLATSYYRDGMRSDRQHPWQGLLPDRPRLGGEIGAVAGVLGVTLATVGDARMAWGTPADTPDRVDMPALDRQSRFVAGVLARLTGPDFHPGDKRPRDVFSTLTGRVNFIRQGELFPDRPAPGTVLCVYQGKTRFYAMTDAQGHFRVDGLANKKLVFDKAVIEGFRFDPETGAAVWAIDKKQTGKDAYRVKMSRNAMETDLVMFGCEQTTLFSAFDPRTFRYFTRIDLLDARREAPPLRYWFSRLDTLDSTLLSIFLEPGTPFKCILSDTVLARKLVLLHASPKHPTGVGYRIDRWPILPVTELLGARDMWNLLGPRVANLESHGVVNERIRELLGRGRALYDQAVKAQEADRPGDMVAAARASWGLAVRVYNDVEKTQRDVLLGVLFYIALFIPFAYCLERVVFNFVDIHKRILAFLGILLTVIAVVYEVHPAFKLTYSPLVVILAFFILGLSVMVATIIFLRFEREMAALQRRASHVKTTEIGGMRAFTAAFVIGVSNLRRRKVRTGLTCLTLVILTFTIMSFTAVKSTREESAVDIAPVAPYRGVLLQNMGWHPLPPEALAVVRDAYGGSDVVAPLAWLELPDRTRNPASVMRAGTRRETVQGVLGLSPAEARFGRLRGLLAAGRWFAPGERDAVLLPAPMAERLGVRPGDRVTFFGRSLVVAGIYRKNGLDDRPDLDGEPLTPVLFPSEAAVEVTEAEKEAIDAGEDVRTLQSRYQHLDDDLTVILPYETLLGLGGQLESIAIAPGEEASGGREGMIPSRTLRNGGEETGCVSCKELSSFRRSGGNDSPRPPEASSSSSLAARLADRFGLAVFAGDAAGVHVFHSGEALSYAGIPNILIPLVISALIVLNTMIGSVYERKREIGVYTAVGLAPSHVSFLFIAEAVAFAVISVVFGYLLAQTAAGLFSGTKIWAGMTANYSSLAGVSAMLLVIGVVLLSVIYPSKVAGDIAIPDVNRSFRLPEPVDGALRLKLPFLVKVREQECAGGFLFDYYATHQDISHGLFSTADVGYRFECPWEGSGAPEHPQVCHPEFYELRACLHLTATVWLAPFDFGIKQQVAIVFSPAMDTPGYMEIDVEIARLAGENAMWKRLNKGFVNDLRKQLLVWRSLEESVRLAYEDKVAPSCPLPAGGVGSGEEPA